MLFWRETFTLHDTPPHRADTPGSFPVESALEDITLASTSFLPIVSYIQALAMASYNGPIPGQTSCCI